jgi:hypothetical protein
VTSTTVRGVPAATLTLAGLMSLAGCGGTQQPDASLDKLRATAQRRAPACAHYPDADLLRYCLATRAHLSPQPPVARLFCAELGPWEETCKIRWLKQHGLDAALGAAALLEFCGEAEQCAMQVLEEMPLESLELRLERCEHNTPSWSDHCSRHALQRWYRAGPSAEDLRFLVRAETVPIVQRVELAAVAAACMSLGTCDDLPADLDVCVRARDRLLAAPAQCPTAERWPHTGFLLTPPPPPGATHPGPRP